MVGLGVVGGPALGQADGASGGGDGYRAAVPDRAYVDVVTRQLLNRMRVRAGNTPSEYRWLATAIEVLEAWAPEDAELLRMRIEALSATGEDAKLEGALRRLVALDPQDTSATLRLLTTTIGKIQTAEGRGAAYERILGSGLDASVLSRIALDAAALAREMGEDERYYELLNRSRALDPTHKAAVALWATDALAGPRSPLGRVRVLGEVVQADPLDAESLENLVSELMAHGAFVGAARFQDLMLGILEAEGTGLGSLERYLDRAVCQLGAEGPEAGLRVIAELQAGIEAASDRERRRERADGFLPEAWEEPVLSSRFEMLRLMVLVAVGDGVLDGATGRAMTFNSGMGAIRIEELERQTIRDLEASPVPNLEEINDRLEALQAGDLPARAEHWRKRLARAEAGGVAWPVLAAYERSIAAVEQELASLDDPEARPEGMREEEIRDFRRSLRLERIWCRLFTGLDLDDAEAELAALLDGPDGGLIDADAMTRMRSWLALLRGEEAGDHIAALRGLGGEALWARWAVAQALAASGDRNGAILELAKLNRDDAAGLVGMIAKVRLEGVLGEALSPTPTAGELDRWARGYLPWLDQMVRGPRFFMQSGLEFVKGSLTAGERPVLRLTLRNVGPVALPIGPAATIPSRFLITRQIRVGGKDIDQALEAKLIADLSTPTASPRAVAEAARTRVRQVNDLSAIVVSMDRRLRLKPREEIAVEVWAGLGLIGLNVDQSVTTQTTIEARAVQGFMVRGEGEIVPSGFGLSPSTGLLQIAPYGRDKSTGQLIEELATAEGEELHRLLLLATSLAAAGYEPGSEAARAQSAVRDAIVATATSLDDASLGWLRIRCEGLSLSQVAPGMVGALNRELAGRESAKCVLVRAVLGEPDIVWEGGSQGAAALGELLAMPQPDDGSGG